jgi:hypothetical protein
MFGTCENCLMSNLARQLLESASAVAALATHPDDIALLDDASLKAGMTLVAAHKRNLQGYEVSIARELTRRSSYELGYDGLARRSGSATPANFIQSLTGGSMDEARRLAGLGQALVDATNAQTPAQPSAAADAALDGRISVDAADAIRRGLGNPDAAVTIFQLEEASASLIDSAENATPEALLKAARLCRAELDIASVERGEKERFDLRYVRRWRKDGFAGGSWRLPDTDGGAELDTALLLLIAGATDGPRFVEKSTKASGDGMDGRVHDTGRAPEDTRSLDQILADGFAQIFHNGITADPSVVPGAGRAAVRVIVAEERLDMMFVSGVGGGVANGGIKNLALLEDTQTAISFDKLSEYLCEGGTVGIKFDSNGEIVNIGREQRLFTRRQRAALGVRDGGCRFPGCNKPPSWCEAHHIKEWFKHQGNTDICNGVLLCRYHHMLMHNRGWQIIRDELGEFWLKPAKNFDPAQQLI